MTEDSRTTRDDAPLWRVPVPRETADVRMADGTTITLRRHGNPDGTRIVFSHGCGLAVDTYLPFWSLLLDRFDIALYDLRNHGWNTVGDRRAHNVPTLVRDSTTILRSMSAHFGEKPTVGVFHSLSALTALLDMTWERMSRFTALVLFDPPIRPPGGAPEDLEALGRAMAAGARRSQSRFDTREEFVASLRQSRVFERLKPGVAELIAETTLCRAVNGPGYELRCPREYQAQIWEYCFGWAMQVDVADLPCPVKVIGADPTVSHSFMPSMDLSALVGLDYDFIPDATHLLMLEDPQACFDAMLGFLGNHGLA